MKSHMDTGNGWKWYFLSKSLRGAYEYAESWVFKMEYCANEEEEKLISKDVRERDSFCFSVIITIWIRILFFIYLFILIVDRPQIIPCVYLFAWHIHETCKIFWFEIPTVTYDVSIKLIRSWVLKHEYQLLITFNECTLKHCMNILYFQIGNLCVILAVWRRRAKHTRMHLFIVHLAVADIIVALFEVLPELLIRLQCGFWASDFLCRYFLQNTSKLANEVE